MTMLDLSRWFTCDAPPSIQGYYRALKAACASFQVGNSLENDTQLKASAVCVLLSPHEDDLQLVLTKRSQQVFHHKGQWCFPGGMWEPSDTSLSETALREAEEELGINRSDVHVIGALEPTTTPTGFHITPFVGVMRAIPIFSPSAHEIERVLVSPLAHLKTREIPDPQARDLFRYEVDEGERVWGATARIVRQVLSLCIS